MKAERLLELYERVADAPEAVEKLRRFVLDLAVRGKLVEQDPAETPASALPRSAEPNGDESNLPPSWDFAKIGRVLNFQYGKGLKASERLEVGPIPVYGSNGVVGFTDTALTERPSIIVGRKGSAGALNLCNGPSWTTDVAYYVEVPEQFDKRFLFIALSAVGLSELGKGVKPGLSRSDAYAQSIVVPPLAEQHRIVAKVDELMALLDRLEETRKAREAARDRLSAASLSRLTASPSAKDEAEDAAEETASSNAEPAPAAFRAHARFALDALPSLTARPDQIKLLRQTILDLAVRGKLVEQDPGDEPGNELFERILARPWKKERNLLELEPSDEALSSLKALPSGWAWATVQALVSPNQTVTYGILKPEWSEEGVPTVRVTEMKTGIIDVLKLPRCKPERAAKFAKTTLRPGDLLISKDGTIGKTAIVPPALSGGNVTQHVLRFPIIQDMDRHFVKLAIDAPFCQSYMAGETKGVALKGVNVGDFRRMPIPIPPRAEQRRIVEKVDKLKGLCDQIERSLKAANKTRVKLLEAVLREALAGSEAAPLDDARDAEPSVPKTRSAVA